VYWLFLTSFSVLAFALVYCVLLTRVRARVSTVKASAPADCCFGQGGRCRSPFVPLRITGEIARRAGKPRCASCITSASVFHEKRLTAESRFRQAMRHELLYLGLPLQAAAMGILAAVLAVIFQET